ncbi:MAG: putative 4-hydroxybenzoate polyprenyltransferase [Planctomycetales bacterium]|nr:putative 4-hydroxybenzoate polyprenyltransferase [Planctomycetales bacterium]
MRELVRRFLQLIRFSHTVFALPFAALACALALATPANRVWSPPSIGLRLTGVLLCMVFARSAAMAFNRAVDAKIDALNPRTAIRHLPSGTLTPPQVWLFFLVNCIGFVGSCLFFLPNWLPLAFSVPVLLWLLGYSFAKRFTSWAHLWLGIALALSPVCAWIAVRGEVVIAEPADVLPAAILGLAIAFWVAGFDIIYACQDANFDRSTGLHSIPARLGIHRALRVSAALHVSMLLVLAVYPIAFPQLSLNWLYAISLAVVAILIVRQHTLVSATDLEQVNFAFFNINAVISFLLASAAILDTCLR